MLINLTESTQDTARPEAAVLTARAGSARAETAGTADAKAAGDGAAGDGAAGDGAAGDGAARERAAGSKAVGVKAVGAKAAVLGRLAAAGFPVPPGFVIPVEAYRAFADNLNLAEVLAEHGSAEVRRLIESQPLPPQLLNELTEALTELGDHPVAVRSSATTEDNADASAAGQHDTYLGVHGVKAVADRVRACWASLWSDRALTYRQTHLQDDDRRGEHRERDPQPAQASADGALAGQVVEDASSHHHDPAIAVIVQRHIDADVAGVMFSGAESSIIEASWGLGESVVQGLVTPDAFTITPNGPTDHRLGSKQTRIDRASTGRTITTQVPPADRDRLCLTDLQLHRLNQLGQAVATHLGTPQDIEFALDRTNLWLLQSRPITAQLPPADNTADDSAGRVQHGTGRSAATVLDGIGDSAGTALHGTEGNAATVLRGIGGSAGTASGVARVVDGPADFGRVGAGEILVCRFTDPAWTPLFGIVAGVVTETGGRLSHAAIVAREHRIPAVLGVPAVMTIVRDGQQITITGSTGTVELAP